MSLMTKSLSIDLQVLALFLSLIPLLQIKALALDTTTSLSLANETDFHALLAFKSNIFQEHQQALSSWNESLYFCHWEGVKCGRRHERVTILDLTSRGLTGSLSPYVGNLSFLRELSLRGNAFTDFQGNEFKALVYEFMPNGSLDNWLHPIPSSDSHGGREFVGLNLLQRIDIAIDVACAIDYLHHQCERPIIHCDLKPSNILLDGDMVACVGDFGLARFHAKFSTPSTSSSTAIRGTIGYAAPEYGLGSEMSTSGDVYSYGILLLEMITRKRPTDIMFEGDLNLHNFTRIALPQRVMEIVDPMLLTEERNSSKMMEYLISVIEIGLACSTESPKDRMTIDIVLCELHLVKNNILKADMEI